MQVRELAKLYTADGPFVSLYLGTDRTQPDAPARYETRWKDALRELKELGVDELTLTALSEARSDHRDGGTRVVIASHGQVHLADTLPEPLRADIVRFAPLPHLLPLIDVLNLRVPHVVVLVDRTGADILAYTDGPEPVEVETVKGTTFQIRKVSTGGWSMSHVQAHAEEQWESNAKDVATVVGQVARDVNPRAIVVAGDVRAVQLFEKQLPVALQPLVQKIDGHRGVDGDTSHVADRVFQVLGDALREDMLALVEKFAEETGQNDRATNGLVETVEAMRLAQVATLILGDDLELERPLWFGPDAALIGVTRDEATLGPGEPQQGDAIDVLIRAAIGTDADIRIVPGGLEQGPREGVGALLRFALGSSGSTAAG